MQLTFGCVQKLRRLYKCVEGYKAKYICDKYSKLSTVKYFCLVYKS